MIKKITITNYLDESIVLELANPWDSGFVVKDISGLGPVKANIIMTELANSDGAIDNSARLGYRNIVMSLTFLEKPTIEDTRLLAYKYFPIKRFITFRVETDNRICETIGRVESNEPNIFSKEEGCQISILCSDPFFYSIDKDDNKQVFYGVKALFEFPFSNESLTEKLINFGEIRNLSEAEILYEGDAEIGFIINIHSTGEARGITIYNTDTREMMKINDEKLESLIGSGIQAGDDIIINTNQRKKSIVMIRNGVETNILNALEKPINWFKLRKGVNHFAWGAEYGLSGLQFSITNKIIYEGV